MVKPLLSYYGGKQRIASRIVAEIDKIPHTVYCEPFCGGAAVLFAKPVRNVSNNDHYREAINDTNKALYNLYRVCQTDRDELLERLTYTPYSKAEYENAGAIYRQAESDPDSILKMPGGKGHIEWARATVIQCHQSFAKKIGVGWGRHMVTKNCAASWHNYRQALPQILDRLQIVSIDCIDALDFIDAWDSPQTLFYCDPPYPGTSCGHYKGYTLDDWQALCTKLDSIQGSYIVSNYQQPVEPDCDRRVEIKASMSAARDKSANKARTEVLWIKDRSHAMRRSLSFARVNQLSLLS